MQATCKASHTTHAAATALGEAALAALAEAVAITCIERRRQCKLCPSMQELGDLRSRLAQVEAAAQQQEQGPRRRRPSSLRELVAAAAAEPITGDLPAHWQASLQQLQDCSLDTRSSSLHSSSESVMDMATVEVPVRTLQHSEHCAGVGSREALPRICAHPRHSCVLDAQQRHRQHSFCICMRPVAQDSQLCLALSLSLLAVRCSLPDRCKLACAPMCYVLSGGCLAGATAEHIPG